MTNDQGERVFTAAEVSAIVQRRLKNIKEGLPDAVEVVMLTHLMNEIEALAARVAKLEL
jgi:hypothetical protein